MKKNSWIILLLILISIRNYAQIPNRGCGTQAPTTQYDSLFQQKIIDYLNTTTAASRVQSTFQIPVIFHVIHGGQAIGTFPNIAQAQLNSQVQVLNDDYSGIGFNTGTYPSTAFLNYAMNTQVLPGSKDAFGNIAIANTGISFCLALKDSLGNILSEPGIERKNWNSIAGASNPALVTTAANLTTLMDNTIKPATIWSPNKYLNIWVTDGGGGLLGYSTFPAGSTLPGIPTGLGTATTDGIWVYGKCFGSSNIFPGGSYAPPFDLGRVCTHETGHWFGLTHIADCPASSDWCDDTPGGGFTMPAGCSKSYPLGVGTCTTYPSNSPDGEMFMNFMGYSDDCDMYMFTQDQANRMNVARLNSPYRKLLGTHGLCPTSCALGINENVNRNNFTIYPNPANDYFILNFTSQSQNIKVIVTDALGKVVFEKYNSRESELKINTSSFSKGIYFVTVSGNGFTEVKKLVID